MENCGTRRKEARNSPHNPGQPRIRPDGIENGRETNREVEFLPDVCGWEDHEIHVPDYVYTIVFRNS